MTALDVRTFRLLHDALSGGAWLPLMVVLTVVGGGWGALTIVPLFAAARTRRLAAFFTATIAANTVLVYALKSIVARPRPWTVLSDIHPLVFAGPKDFSFPSGHAAGSFCYATFVALVVVRTRTSPLRWLGAALLLALATGVALSRIALGVHFPGDVAAGALIGASIGAIGSELFIRRATTSRSTPGTSD